MNWYLSDGVLPEMLVSKGRRRNGNMIGNVRTVQVASAVVHTLMAKDRMTGNVAGDIAVLKLQAPLWFSKDDVEVAKLAPAETTFRLHQKCTIAGWGDTGETLIVFSNDRVIKYLFFELKGNRRETQWLQKATLEILPASVCSLSSDDESKICAGDRQGNADACHVSGGLRGRTSRMSAACWLKGGGRSWDGSGGKLRLFGGGKWHKSDEVQRGQV